MSYTLRFPIRLAPGRKVNDLDQEPKILDGKIFRFIDEKPYLVTLIEGFEDESSALAYLPRLQAALYWAAIDHGLAFTAERKPEKVTNYKDPIEASKNLRNTLNINSERVDGFVNSNFPCAYPTGRKILKMTACGITLSLGTQYTKFLNSFSTGLAEIDASTLEDKRLGTALALFSSRYHELSANAHLLALVMAIEVLTEKTNKAPIAMNLLKRWALELEGLREKTKDKDELEALDSLKRELLFRRESSLRSRVRVLVSSVPQLNADDIQRAVKIYDERSKLVHEGSLPPTTLQKAVTDAERIVGEVLKHRLRG